MRVKVPDLIVVVLVFFPFFVCVCVFFGTLFRLIEMGESELSIQVERGRWCGVERGFDRSRKDVINTENQMTSGEINGSRHLILFAE